MNNLPKNIASELDKLPSFNSKVNWGTKNHARFTELMNELLTLLEPGFYVGDNVLTWCRNNSLCTDVAFQKAWSDNCLSEVDIAIAWRRYILASMAYHCVQLPGDFVECGVHWGTGIKTVMDYLGGSAFAKPFWGYDTFLYPSENSGIAEPQNSFFAQVQQRFADYKQVKLIRGLIAESLRSHRPTQIAYLHIDLNNTEAEIAALDALFELVVAGGVIILDDYEWSIHREQKIAEDLWFDQRNYHVMPLPTGQGLVIKR